jgi:hypothetical protein
MRKLFSILAATAMFVATSSIAQAQDDGAKDFAEYSAGVSISPFGPGLNLTYNIDAKNSISAGFGFLPEGDVPEAFLPEFTTAGGFAVTGTASWLGVFWRHRPFTNQNIGFNLGLASGQIENNLTANNPMHEGEENPEFASYSVNYSENPVMYFGVNYGSKPVKGFQFGVDLGVLSTGGANIQYTGDPDEGAEHPLDRVDEINDIRDNLAWSMLPNVQLSVSYGF